MNALPTQTTSLAKYRSVEEGRTALARVQAVQTAIAMNVIYDMEIEVARTLLGEQPVPFLANLVAQDGACDGAYLMTLLSPENAADAIVAAVIETGGKTVQFVPVNIDQAIRLFKEGQRKMLMRSGGKYWWLEVVGDKVSEDLAYQQVRLILGANATDEWKVGVLNRLDSDFLAFACQSSVNDGDAEGLLLDRINRLDADLGASVEATLRAKDFGELHNDVLFLWDQLGKRGKIVTGFPPAGEAPIEVSEATLAQLVDEIA